MIAGGGTDIGSGQNGKEEAAQYGHHHPRGQGGGFQPRHQHPDQTNAQDPTLNPYQTLWGWCQSVVTILNDYKYMIAPNARGNFKVLRETLVRGLMDAKDSYTQPSQGALPYELLTRRALHRGLMLNNFLFLEGDEFENQVVSVLLSRFYDHVIHVNLTYDQKFTFPYFNSQWNPQPQPNQPQPQFNEVTFYVSFADYAIDLLQFGLEQSAWMGTAIYELVLFKNVLNWVIEDLDMDILGRHYFCITSRLDALYHMIDGVLQDPVRRNTESVHVVRLTRQWVSYAIDALKSVQKDIRKFQNHSCQQTFTTPPSLGPYPNPNPWGGHFHTEEEK